MTAVDVQGLISQRRKMQRRDNENMVRQAHDLAPRFMKEDKSGKCYTYRGVRYCRWARHKGPLGGLF